MAYNVDSNRSVGATHTTYRLRNLWMKKETGDTRKPLQATVPAHDVLMLRLIKQ